MIRIAGARSCGAAALIAAIGWPARAAPTGAVAPVLDNRTSAVRVETGPIGALRDARPAVRTMHADRIVALLDARAAAVRAGDEAAFRRTMEGAPATFVRARLTWFRALRALDVADYRIGRDLDGPETYPARIRAGFDETTVIAVRESLALDGYDDGAPQVLPGTWTLGRRGDVWSVIADDELADVGLLPARDLWDLGPVRTVESDGILMITRGPLAQARTIRTQVAQARTYVGRRWPFGAPEKIAVLIPGSTKETSRLFNDLFDVSNFRGFASSTLWRKRGEVVYGGHRLILNAGNFLRAADRTDILSHEVLHLAATPRSGPRVPSWFEEGIAQVYGERMTRSDPAARTLPEDHDFSGGTPRQISRAYDASDRFVRYLIRRFGRGAVARFYAAVGAEVAVQPGTDRYHLDRTARRVLKTPFAALVRAWRAG